MRLVWAFDAVLLVLTIGREERRDLVYAGRAGTPKRTRYVADDLADPELVLAHTILLSHPIALRRRKFLIQRLKTSTTARRRSNCYVFSELAGRQRKRAEQFTRSASHRLDLRTQLYMCCKDRHSLVTILLGDDIERRYKELSRRQS